MADDVTKDTGNYGRFRALVDVTSQSVANNTSTLRVRGILYNDSPTGTAFNNDGVSVSISGTGSLDYSGTHSLSISGGSSDTMIDRSFTVNHSSDGTRSELTFNVGIGDTGTSAFGNPPTITLTITPPRIPKKPDAPRSVSNSFDAPHSVTVTWTAPADDGGPNISGYDIQFDTSSSFSSPGIATVSGSTRSREIDPSLSIGHTWYFRVRATNSQGDGPWSSATSRVIPDVPEAPSQNTPTFQAPKQVTVSWDAADNNGASIDQYQVAYSQTNSTSGATLVSAGTSRSKAIGGLVIHDTWYFFVRAHSSQGWGAWSSAKSYTIPNIPSAPGAPTLAASPPSTLNVSWAAPANGGATITGYNIQYSTSSSFSSYSTATSTTTSVALTGLAPGSTYYVRVVAKNSQGSSAAGASASQLVYAGPRVNATTWKNTVAYVNVGGTWKVAVPYVNVSGTWKIAGG